MDGSILVPYSPETKASGVAAPCSPASGCTTTAPLLPSGRGAGAAALRRGGRCLCGAGERPSGGGHRGGYWPFTLDVTSQLNDTGRNSLWVAVQDPTDSGTQARGKQTLKPGGMFYPAQSGIWQTVWMERVPENYIQSLTVTPDYDARTVTVKAHTSLPGGAANLWAVVRPGA